MRKQQGSLISPIAHTALAVSTAARIALEVIAEPDDEITIGYEAVLAVMRSDPAYALRALHDEAAALDVPRSVQSHSSQVQHLSALCAAGVAIAEYLVDRAAGTYNGRRADPVTCALNLELEQPEPAPLATSARRPLATLLNRFNERIRRVAGMRPPALSARRRKPWVPVCRRRAGEPGRTSHLRRLATRVSAKPRWSTYHVKSARLSSADGANAANGSSAAEGAKKPRLCAGTQQALRRQRQPTVTGRSLPG